MDNQEFLYEMIVSTRQSLRFVINQLLAINNGETRDMDVLFLISECEGLIKMLKLLIREYALTDQELLSLVDERLFELSLNEVLFSSRISKVPGVKPSNKKAG